MQNGNPPHGAWYADAPLVANTRKRKAKKLVREDDVEGKYVAAREAEGKLVLKVKVLGRPGYPDRLVLGATDVAAVRLQENIRYATGANVPLEACARYARECVAEALSWAELKKQANSVFQPKQKTIIPMLRKRGFKVDIIHG